VPAVFHRARAPAERINANKIPVAIATSISGISVILAIARRGRNAQAVCRTRKVSRQRSREDRAPRGGGQAHAPRQLLNMASGSSCLLSISLIALVTRRPRPNRTRVIGNIARCLRIALADDRQQQTVAQVPPTSIGDRCGAIKGPSPVPPWPLACGCGDAARLADICVTRLGVVACSASMAISPNGW